MYYLFFLSKPHLSYKKKSSVEMFCIHSLVTSPAQLYEYLLNYCIYKQTNPSLPLNYFLKSIYYFKTCCNSLMYESWYEYNYSETLLKWKLRPRKSKMHKKTFHVSQLFCTELGYRELFLCICQNSDPELQVSTMTQNNRSPSEDPTLIRWQKPEASSQTLNQHWK